MSLWTLFTLTFVLMRAVPGDPLLREKDIPAETRANLLARYGLDQPLLTQYWIQLKRIVFEFDFGTSFRMVGREVNDIIREQFPVSATIGVVAVVVGLTAGAGLGVLASLYRNGWIDRAAMILCVLGISLPSFLIAYLAQFFLAVYPLTHLGVNPDLWIRPAGWGEPRDVILPALTLSLGVIASVARMMRGQMVEVAFSDYVKTAKAKGASGLRLVVFHQLRNACLPIVSIMGPMLVFAMTGSLVVEGIMGIPGLGRSFLASIQNSDYSVIMGLTVFYGGFFALVNFLTDILYGLVDPRIRVG